MYARTSTPRINQSTTTTRLYFPAKIKECIITKEKKKKRTPTLSFTSQLPDKNIKEIIKDI